MLFARSALLVASVLGVVACSSSDEEHHQQPSVPAPTPEQPTTPPAAAVAVAPTLEPTACRFLVPTSVEGKTFHCADLSVKENRRDATSTRMIKIHVAVMHGKDSRDGGVPMIELVGGPGGSSEDLVGNVAAKTKRAVAEYGKFLEKGDVVFFDQRGTGRSIPRLYCDMYGGQSLTACRAGFEKEGIDVAAYDTIENADDVHDLVRALGAPKGVDLHGISYGTRLGIEIMKRHPDDVRAAIIDGVMAPDVPVLGYFEVTIDNILAQVFASCAADTKCNAAYPSLDTTLGDVKKKLDATPFKLTDRFGDYNYEWEAFMGDLIEHSYKEGEAARIPHWLYTLKSQTEAELQAAQDKDAAASEAKYQEEQKADADNPLAAELLKRQMASTEEDFISADMAYGMYLSVTCNDYAQHESLDAVKAAMTKIRPELQSTASVEEEFQMCDAWAKRPSDPSVRTASTFAGNVLVIGGKLDPATPYTWAERVSSTLPTDQFVLVPTGGHGLMDACGVAMKSAFLLDPSKSVDATCATSRSIQFYYGDDEGAGGGAGGNGHAAHHQPSKHFDPHGRSTTGADKTPMSRVAARILAGVGADRRATEYRAHLSRVSLSGLF